MSGSQAAEARQGWLAVLANAPLSGIEDCIARAAPLPAHTRLRGPETGLVMVQGRAGGDGAPFNLGEMTVTRCTVRNAQGQIGHAYLAGRDPSRAELVAALDAVLQHPTEGAEWVQRVVAPLAEAQTEARRKVAGEAAATRVDFFTLATMRS